MKKISLFLCAIVLVLFSGCDWFSKKEGSQKERVVINNEVVSITSEEHFKKEVLEHKKPVVVKFGTVWCGACETMKPIYKAASEKYKDKMKFVDVDADKLGGLVQEHNIQGYPTFIFFKEGKKVKIIPGEMKDDELEGYIEDILE